MLSRMYVHNFRSLAKAEIPLSKINVLTGLNNSGKTSLLQAAAMLKNVVSNPNKPVDQQLMLPKHNFGGFSELVHEKNIRTQIVFGVTYKEKRNVMHYALSLAPDAGVFYLKSKEIEGESVSLPVNFPYPLNQQKQIKNKQGEAFLNWNGITFTPLTEDESAVAVAAYFNRAFQSIQGFDYVESGLKFSRVLYGKTAITDYTTEEQIASAIAVDRDLEGKLSHYFEKIFEEKFSVRFVLGTANFHLQTRNKATGFVTDLVNQGSGQNQVIYLLARILRKGVSLICLDEPVIHLHPSTIRKLMRVFVEIAEEEGKQFLLATHNEHLVNALLMEVLQKTLKPKDVNVFYLDKPAKATRIERQKINEDGQIKGGLKHFLDVELEDLRLFLKA